jgi:outer membrane protein insertion porin family/translocation and assembly module TamA
MPLAISDSIRRRLAGALPRLPWKLLAAACFLCLPAAPLAAQGGRSAEADQLENPEIGNLALVGVKVMDQDEIRKSIATDESHCNSLLLQIFCAFSKSKAFYTHVYLDRAEFERDVLRIKVFYFKRGYRHTQVDTAIARAGRGMVNVTFRIKEGPPTLIDSLSVVQDSAVLPPKELRRQLRIGKGGPLDLLKLDSTVVRLQQALWDRGFADAVIDSTVTVDAAANRAQVAIHIDPKWQAKVGSIVVRREAAKQRSEISDQTILNSLSLRPGDIYQRKEVLNSQRTLYESNLFTRASILVPPQGDSIKLLEVSVREAPLREVRTTLGYTTVDFIVAGATFTDYNFLGGARRLTLQGAVGNLLAKQALKNNLPFTDSKLGKNFLPLVEDKTSYFGTRTAPFFVPTWQLSASLTQPWFQSPRNTIGASLFTHRRSAFGVYIDRGLGAQASFTREVTERTPASVAYRYELTKVEAGDVYFCVNFGVCDVVNIAALRKAQSLSPVTASIQRNTTDDPFSPASGTRAALDLEHASQITASDYRYNRVFGNGSTYRRVRHRGVLAFRVQAGYVHALSGNQASLGVTGGTNEALQASILHPRTRFYAGGSQSVRGFGENQLGPRVLTVPVQQLARIGCDVSSPAALQTCDPNGFTVVTDTAGKTDTLRLSDADFVPRPLGGNVLIGGNVEYRFPIWGPVGGVAFVDGAIVSQGSLADATKGTGAITPGFGIRYYSPVGPIRVDMGFNPVLTQELLVVTEQVVDGKRRIVQLSDANRRTYAPAKTGDSFFQRATNRLTLHLSIGQAF